MATVGTSTSSAATAYPNQRKVARFSNGVLLGVFKSGTFDLVCRYSADNGATWNTPTAGASLGSTYTGTPSVFIDDANYVHVVCMDNANILRYIRGTPTTTTSTGYTWSSALSVASSGYDNYPDVVAHAEGTGWKAHVVWSDSQAGAARYARVSITSGGTMTIEGATIVDNYGSGHCYPSIALEASKRFHVVLTTGMTGGGFGVRYRSAGYSSGSWTWGTEEAVTESYYANRMGPCVADSQGRVLVAFSDHVSGYLRVFRRGTAGDWTDMLTGQNTVNNPTLTVDSNDNPYVFYMRSGGLSGINYIWHTGSSWTSETNVEGGVCDYPSARRDTSGSAVDVLYTTGSSSPYAVKAFRLTLAQKRRVRMVV